MSPTEIAVTLGYLVVREHYLPDECSCTITVESYPDQDAFCDLCKENGYNVVPVTYISLPVYIVAWFEKGGITWQA